jgi:hypothetical protein
LPPRPISKRAAASPDQTQIAAAGHRLSLVTPTNRIATAPDPRCVCCPGASVNCASTDPGFAGLDVHAVAATQMSKTTNLI